MKLQLLDTMGSHDGVLGRFRKILTRCVDAFQTMD